MGNILINHGDGGVYQTNYQADHSEGFNADFFYNSTADEIIFKRIKPIIKDFELKLISVSPPLVNSLPTEHKKTNNIYHPAGAGHNIFKPLFHKSIITRKPPLAQHSDQNLRNKHLNKKPLSTTYLAPSIFNLNLDLNKTGDKSPPIPISDSYLPLPKSSSIVKEKIKIVSVSDSYLPPPKSSNIDLSELNQATPTTTQSIVERGNSKKTKETFKKNSITYSYIAPIKSTQAALKGDLNFSPDLLENEENKPSINLTQYSAPNIYLPPVNSQDSSQVQTVLSDHLDDIFIVFRTVPHLMIWTH